MLTLTTEPMDTENHQQDSESDVSTGDSVQYSTLSAVHRKMKHSAVLFTMLMAVASVVMTTVTVSNLACIQCDDAVVQGKYACAYNQSGQR